MIVESRKMKSEIERKFLVLGNDFKRLAKPVFYKQAYLTVNSLCTVRVRVAGNQGLITIKGKTTGISRPEYEYEIPVTEANELINNFSAFNVIEKYRYCIEFEGNIWEIDEFLGDNSGLVVAEIELNDENQQFVKPQWVGEEVSYDKRYSNSYLSQSPFTRW